VAARPSSSAVVPVKAGERALVAELGALRDALERARVEARVWRRGPKDLPPFEDLEEIRAAAYGGAGMPASTFCELVGISRRTWYRRRARSLRRGRSTEWSSPVRPRTGVPTKIAHRPVAHQGDPAAPTPESSQSSINCAGRGST
jgi:hypothetical protein